MTTPAPSPTRPADRRALVVVEFVVLLAFWLALSGQYNALFIGMGIASAALVTATTHDLVARALGPPAGGLRTIGVRAWRTVLFVGWLLGRAVPAGLQVAFFVLHPRMPVRPGVLRFKTTLRSQVARTVLANTITLVPGTLTLTVTDDEFVVHALVPESADDLVSALMQNRIAHLFLQAEEQAPAVTWDTERPR